MVPSDPPEPADGTRTPITISAVGEPPFFLYCNHCRWDSVDAGITFDKPTGLALQLQKTEDSAPEILELEKLKDYFEPALRQAQAQQQLHASSVSHLNPIQAAASSALSRDIPSFKYSSGRRPGAGTSSSRRGVPPAMPSPGTGQQDIDDPATEYKPRIWMSAGGGVGHDAEVEWLANLGSQGADGARSSQPATPISHTGEVASLSQRLHATQFSWAPTHSLRTVDLKPTRVPLRSKKSKRCPKCTHILIKPELKAQSTKWKIKLVAGNYLPGVEVGSSFYASF